MAEKSIDDPALLLHQSVDTVDVSIVGQIAANAILDVDGFAVAAAILAIDAVSTIVGDLVVYTLCCY